MALKRTGSAQWNGNGKDGSGKLNTPSGVLNETPYSFATRFQSEDGKAGTNPEELIAAAHAGCFSMQLSFMLAGEGFPPTELKTQVSITMDKQEGGFVFSNIHLDVEGTVPTITAEKFQEIAESAKKNCPVSKALSSVAITMTAKLV